MNWTPKQNQAFSSYLGCVQFSSWGYLAKMMKEQTPVTKEEKEKLLKRLINAWEERNER